MDTTKPQEDLQNQAAANAAALASGDAREITLDVPLKRPGGDLARVLVRRPNAGALRGLSLVELLHMNVTALQTLLPRVTEPMLHKAEVLQLDPADLVTWVREVAFFWVPKAQREQSPSAKRTPWPTWPGSSTGGRRKWRTCRWPNSANGMNGRASAMKPRTEPVLSPPSTPSPASRPSLARPLPMTSTQRQHRTGQGALHGR